MQWLVKNAYPVAGNMNRAITLHQNNIRKASKRKKGRKIQL
jgi:hypothetical protein